MLLVIDNSVKCSGLLHKFGTFYKAFTLDNKALVFKLFFLFHSGGLWGHNTVVKFSGDLYRSFDPVTVAAPANSTHARFYKLFHNPSLIYDSLTIIQTCIILLGISLLYYATEWHFILSLTFITLTNQFTFLKLMRDYLITKRVYLAELTDIKLMYN